MTELVLSDCPWLEPGGADAAAMIGAFLVEAGIPLRIGSTTGKTFVPGLSLEDGTVVIDPAVASYPGDLLHEAGHLAVASPEQRSTLGEVGENGGDEMAAIAWSVAAARGCGVPLAVLFHEAGYKGGAAELVRDWEAGQPFGVPLLQWYGMTRAADFPAMTRWLR